MQTATPITTRSVLEVIRSNPLVGWTAHVILTHLQRFPREYDSKHPQELVWSGRHESRLNKILGSLLKKGLLVLKIQGPLNLYELRAVPLS